MKPSRAIVLSALVMGVVGGFGGPFSLGVGAARAAEHWSAGVRENYITAFQYNFGSDGMARVKYGIFSQGFSSLTVHLRLGVESVTNSYVYLPRQRTNADDLGVLIARVDHAEASIVFKPVISLKPGLGVAPRLADYRPSDPALFFATYEQALGQYVALARKRDVAEFVLGVGMHSLWNARYGRYWVNMAKQFRSRMGDSVRLSIELSSAADWKAMENWKESGDPSFAEFLSELNLIRFSPELEPQGAVTADWSASSITSALGAEIRRARALFPGKEYTLSNVTFPACRSRRYIEDEVECESPMDKGFQLSGLQSWFKAYDSLSIRNKSSIFETEFMEATTDNEPKEGAEDPRFLYYNPGTWEVFEARKRAGTHSAGSPSRTPSSVEGSAAADTPRKRACVFFDETGKDKYLGNIHSQLLQNLLGAFRSWTVKREPILDYKPGDLARCDVAFYIASNYFLAPPAAFLPEAAEFARTKRLFWMNYRFWTFAKAYQEAAAARGEKGLGFNSTRISQPLSTPSPTNLDPGFFRYFDYKGETFEKLAQWNPVSNIFVSSPELNLIDVSRPASVHVLSTARHSKLKQTVPYAVRESTPGGGEVWYIADDPFTFVHYEDRYLIFCDLLWDFLRETPPPGPRVALIRIEDVNPMQNQTDLLWAIDWLADHHVPFSMAVIPYYSDVFGVNGAPMWKPATRFPRFVGTLRYAKARGANFVFHGVAHQEGDLIGGFDGTSADDYEFWMYPQNVPNPNDSSDFLINRVEKGVKVFQDLGIRPIAWETPHYASSVLDSYLFGDLFEWTYQRSIYVRSELLHPAPLGPQYRFFDCVSAECQKERLEKARELSVSADYSQFGGQIFPYIVWKDVYGQKVIPETLGDIEYPFFDKGTWRPVNHPADLIRIARKLRVIRGAVASFFWHPDLLNPDLRYYQNHPGDYETEGGKNTLIKTIRGIQALGYQFRSISDCSLFPRENCGRGEGR